MLQADPHLWVFLAKQDTKKSGESKKREERNEE